MDTWVQARQGLAFLSSAQITVWLMHDQLRAIIVGSIGPFPDDTWVRRL